MILTMRPQERRESGQTDLFRARLDQIVNLTHPLARLARMIDWSFLETRLGELYDDDPGRPPLPTRLMGGLAILKHLHDLSDEALCARWLENPLYQDAVVNDLSHPLLSALGLDQDWNSEAPERV